jgi:hypothetical protein
MRRESGESVAVAIQRPRGPFSFEDGMIYCDI